jgi:uncharacterized repeat protein (TIGR03803 family)
MKNTVKHWASTSWTRLRLASTTLAFAVMLVPAAVTTQSAQAQTFTVLYSFTGASDGALPEGALLRDSAGNLYGTTVQGGKRGCAAQLGCGTVFKLDTTGRLHVLHAFNQQDGASPIAALIHDSKGNFYGTTRDGGAALEGTVFKLDSTGNERVLHSFNFQQDGEMPYGGLVRDAAGNFYGTTPFGGPPNGGFYGTVFKLDTTGNVSVLHTFTGGSDGKHPYGGLVRDAAGNMYGTTQKGGGNGCLGGNGCGTVFKIDAAGNYTRLYSFTGPRTNGDGSDSHAGLIRDASGNLYGTTYDGGAADKGTVFKLDTTGSETVLYSFTDQPDGANPIAGLVRDASGNLYGTTFFGGNAGCQFGCGTVFKLDTTGKETVLYRFTGGSDGSNPYAGVIIDAQGNLYGTAGGGNGGPQCGFVAGCGTVFKLTP